MTLGRPSVEGMTARGSWALRPYPVLCALVCALTAHSARGEEPQSHPASPPAEAHDASPETKKDECGGGAKAELEELAKKLQNPVSDLISVPFQFNTDFDIGPYGRTANVLNIQPVIPIHLTEDWNLVSRSILPIAWAPDPTKQYGTTFGLSDLTETLFLAPSKPHGFIWGIGPAIVLPTATSSRLGSSKWSVGPAVVVLVQPKPWTFGAVAWNTWSVFGASDRPNVSSLTAQYFVNYNLPKGFYLTSAPIISANWKHNSWTVPFGGGAGAILLVDGKLPINLQVSAYYNVVRAKANPVPSDIASKHDAATPSLEGPAWQLRVQLALLFPQ
jgi:hypothetical protein